MVYRRFLAPIMALLLLPACTREIEKPGYGDPLPELMPTPPAAFERYRAEEAIDLTLQDASAICRAAVAVDLGVSPNEGRVSFNNANFVDIAFGGQTHNCVVGRNGIGTHHPQPPSDMHSEITGLKTFAYQLASDRVVIIRETDQGMTSSTVPKKSWLR
jgi:hypothetical protein